MILVADYSGLLKAMKMAGVEATNAGGPVKMCFGRVLSIEPLQILVDQKLTLGKSQLILSRNVTDYETEITIEPETEKKRITIHNSLVVGDELLLLREQGGQKYIVIDRMGKI